MENDSTPSPVVPLSLISRIGDHLEDQVPDTARSECGRVPADTCQVIEVHDARPIVRRIAPGTRPANWGRDQRIQK